MPKKNPAKPKTNSLGKMLRLKGDTFLNNCSSLFKKHSKRVLKTTIFAFLLLLIPSQQLYLKQIFSPVPKKHSFNLPEPPPLPLDKKIESPPQLSAEGIVVLDVNSGVTLYTKNPDARLSPASTTKIVTGLVALDKFNLDEILTVKTVEHTKNIMGLVAGERISFENLLYGLLVYSANDAALTIAENFPGGVNSFVESMNAKAASLHLENTHFANPIGFDDPNQFSTASDLARLTYEALKNKTVAKIVSTRAITVSDESFTYFHDLRNVNQLLGEIPGVAGVKTGYTQNAAECLISLVRRDHSDIIAVVLRSDDRFKDSAILISWIYRNFKWVPIAEYMETIQAKEGQ